MSAGRSSLRTGAGWRTCRMSRGGMRFMCGHFFRAGCKYSPHPSAELLPGHLLEGGAGGQWQGSTSVGVSPRWGADGKELYYIAPDSKLMAAPIAVSGSTIEPGTPV